MKWFTVAGQIYCWFTSYTLWNMITTTQKQKIYKSVLGSLLCGLDSVDVKIPVLTIQTEQPAKEMINDSF